MDDEALQNCILRSNRCGFSDKILSATWAYGVVVSMFGFHRSDRGLNPGRGGKIS